MLITLIGTRELEAVAGAMDEDEADVEDGPDEGKPEDVLCRCVGVGDAERGVHVTGVVGAANATGPGVPGAEGENGAGCGRQPGDERRHPEAIAHLTLFFATSSLVASAASYTRGMLEPRRQCPASSITSSGKLSCLIDVVYICRNPCRV